MLSRTASRRRWPKTCWTSPSPSPPGLRPRPPQPEKPAPRTAPAPRETTDLSPKPLASPAVRLRARESGIDLRQVAGTGGAGITLRISISSSSRGAGPLPAQAGLVADRRRGVRMTGLRRRIAEKMSPLHLTHPPHHLCGRGGHDGARGSARDDEPRPQAGAGQAHDPAFS